MEAQVNKNSILAFRHSCFPTTTSHSSVQQSVMRKNVVSAIPKVIINNQVQALKAEEV